MPTDETRRLLRAFGMAVTTFEDAVHNRNSADEIADAERQVRTLLDEITALIDRLGREGSAPTG